MIWECVVVVVVHVVVVDDDVSLFFTMFTRFPLFEIDGSFFRRKTSEKNFWENEFLRYAASSDWRRLRYVWDICEWGEEEHLCFVLFPWVSSSHMIMRHRREKIGESLYEFNSYFFLPEDIQKVERRWKDFHLEEFFLKTTTAMSETNNSPHPEGKKRVLLVRPFQQLEHKSNVYERERETRLMKFFRFKDFRGRECYFVLSFKTISGFFFFHNKMRFYCSVFSFQNIFLATNDIWVKTSTQKDKK